MEISGKGFITYLGFKTKARSHKYKKAGYSIGNVSKKDLSKIIRDFEKFEKLTSEKKRPKHEPTDSYFYLARQLAKCMMIYDTLKWRGYGGYTEMTALYSKVYSTDEDESKRIIVHETLSQSCSTNDGKSKLSIVNETLLQNYSADVDELCSTKIDISEYTITEQKDADYEEFSVTKEVPSYFNIFECGRNILDKLDVTYERACMATPKDK